MNEIRFTPGRTYTLSSGKTQTVLGDMIISGTGSFPVRIQSSTSGSQSTFYKSTGTVCVDYVRLSDNNATGGALFYAGTNSEDLGGNTGWNFTNIGGTPSVSISNTTPGAICSGKLITLNASATNADSIGLFSWYINGSVTGTDSSVFPSNTLHNGDVVSVVLNMSSVCLGNVVDTASFVIAFTDSVTFNVMITDAQCGNTGEAKVQMVTGQSPFSFLWSNNDTTQIAKQLAAGLYTITVTDSQGCSGTDNATIHVGSGGIDLSLITNNTTCGQNNGTVQAAINTGTGPFRYLWNTGDTTAIVLNLSEGQYEVTVVSSGGCTIADTATVASSLSLPDISISVDKPTICAQDSAYICAAAGYQQYIWNTGETTKCLYSKQAGNYYLTVTDNNGCTATSNHIGLSVYPVPSVSISVKGDTLTVYNGIAFQWYFNNSLISGETSPILIAKQAGNYQVEITDANGCHARSVATFIAVGINDLAGEGAVRIYPNPSPDGAWIIEAQHELVGSIAEVFDGQGRKVYEMKISANRFPVELNVARGIYWLRIQTEEQSLITKLIKM
ncbi:MAG: T9SS type A sorting domain-containing protein [Bacteroidetes bacterium]|nr:T9SS type A sorting domain-containing protein [Bacteroidota bacterium]